VRIKREGIFAIVCEVHGTDMSVVCVYLHRYCTNRGKTYLTKGTIGVPGKLEFSGTHVRHKEKCRIAIYLATWR